MDVFVEQTVMGKRRALNEALYYLAWGTLVVCGVLGLMSAANILGTTQDGGFGVSVPAIVQAVVLLGVAFLLWRATFRLRTEYDYTFTNGTVDVARVMNGKKRVYLTSFDTRDLRAAGEEGSPACQACARESGVQIHRWYKNADARKYFFCFVKKGAKHLVLLELNDEMVAAIFNRRFLSAEVWDGAYKSI